MEDQGLLTAAADRHARQNSSQGLCILGSISFFSFSLSFFSLFFCFFLICLILITTFILAIIPCIVEIDNILEWLVLRAVAQNGRLNSLVAGGRKRGYYSCGGHPYISFHQLLYHCGFPSLIGVYIFLTVVILFGLDGFCKYKFRRCEAKRNCDPHLTVAHFATTLTII